jgi:hypothetical protein
LEVFDDYPRLDTLTQPQDERCRHEAPSAIVDVDPVEAPERRGVQRRRGELGRRRSQAADRQTCKNAASNFAQAACSVVVRPAVSNQTTASSTEAVAGCALVAPLAPRTGAPSRHDAGERVWNRNAELPIRCGEHHERGGRDDAAHGHGDSE